jgi:hypothetical protein
MKKAGRKACFFFNLMLLATLIARLSSTNLPNSRNQRGI